MKLEYVKYVYILKTNLKERPKERSKSEEQKSALENIKLL